MVHRPQFWHGMLVALLCWVWASDTWQRFSRSSPSQVTGAYSLTAPDTKSGLVTLEPRLCSTLLCFSPQRPVQGELPPQEQLAIGGSRGFKPYYATVTALAASMFPAPASEVCRLP